MRIEMVRTAAAAVDIRTTKMFQIGKVYNLADDVAASLIENGDAIPFRDKALNAAPENKGGQAAAPGGRFPGNDSAPVAGVDGRNSGKRTQLGLGSGRADKTRA